MVGLLAIVEPWLSKQEMDLSSQVAFWRQSGEDARRRVADRTVLCLGDSQVKMGLVPAVIEYKLGSSAYNLAMASSTAPAHFFLLRRAIESGAKPEAIVVDFKANLLAADLQENAAYWPELLSARECLEVSLTARDPEFFAKTMLARGLASVRLKSKIQTRVLGALRGEKSHARITLAPYIRNWRVNDGAWVSPSNPSYNGEVQPEDAELYPETWNCNPVNRTFVKRFLRLATDQNIKVYWLIAPISPAPQIHREELGFDALYSEFVREIQAEFLELVVLDARRSGYDHSVFVDAVHLDRVGAAHLSADVAEIIDQRLTGPAWIKLPRFVRRDEMPSLEDVEQSRMAQQAHVRGARR